MATALELLEPVGDGLALEVGRRARDLHQGKLERQSRISALAHVVHGDRKQVAEAQDRRLAQLVRLRAQPLARFLGQRQRVGHLAHVLDEHHVPQVVEQLRDEPAEILALVGELLDERERAGGVAVDDEVAEPEQGLFLDGAEELEDGLHGHLSLCGGRELVERRDRVAEAPRAPSARSARATPPGPRFPRPRRRASGSGRSRAGAGRESTKVWQRERTVPIIFWSSVVQKTKTRWGGGSSISFSSALKAASVSWCASSRM